MTIYRVKVGDIYREVDSVDSYAAIKVLMLLYKDESIGDTEPAKCPIVDGMKVAKCLNNQQ